MQFKPIWSDSMGAKSLCTFVETPDIRILIDPGVAIMQPGFPASITKKMHWLRKAKLAIKRASKKVEVIIISHYHYDHFTDFDKDLYKGKKLLLKNPNEYINYSQRKRSEDFLQNICKSFGEVDLRDLLIERKFKGYEDPGKELPVAMSRDFGSYNERRKELLDKGGSWFRKLAKHWNEIPEVPELKFDEIEIRYPEGKEFEFGETRLKFTGPLFHGIEYARVGWIFSTIIEYKGEKLIYSSDMNGPIIEDYREWIIREDPRVLILDGPATYLVPYMLNLINLRRAIDNIIEIIKGTSTDLIILDHHLLRDYRYRETLKEVYRIAKRKNKEVLTAAEYLGKTPVLDLLNYGCS